MPITRDNDAYEQRQLKLLRDLLLTIKDELEGADLDHDQVAELTGRIGYAVTSVIDGDLTGETTSALPRLAFAASGTEPDRLVVNDRGSYLHELVYSLFAEIFDAEEDEDEYGEEDEGDEEDEEDLDDEAFEEDDFEDENDDHDNGCML